MNLSRPFITRPIMTTILSLTLLLAGLLAFVKLPVSDLPNIEHPQITISTQYRGASPEIILNEITIPLEKELTHVKGVQEMKSHSSSGSSSVSLEFDLSKDMNEAIKDVQAAINRAIDFLPKDLDSKPTYSQRDDSQEAILWLILTSDQANVNELAAYANAYITPKLQRLEGVAKIQIFGEDKSLRIQLDPELMKARRITFDSVIETIKDKLKVLPLGNIQTESKKLAIEWPSTLHNAKDFENILIKGSDVKLKEIGQISNINEDEQEFHKVSHEYRHKAFGIGIQKFSEANTVSVSRLVTSAVLELQQELPQSMHLNIWFDKAVWIHESLVDVEWSLFFAILLVAAVIYLSLGRLLESLIATLSLPLSLFGTLVIMYLLHFSLDLLSLLALTLSVGFIVDDVIVVIENVVRNQDGANSAKMASLKGSKQISFTILSMTLALVAVFIPLLFMGGMNGRLFREFSLTLAIAILISGVISLTTTPMLCSKLPLNKKSSKTQNLIHFANQKLVDLYKKTLLFCLSYKKTVLVLLLLCTSSAIYLFTKLPVNLIPPEDRGFFFVFSKLPSGISPTQQKETQKKLEDLILTHSHISDFLSLNFEGSLFFVVRLDPLKTRPPLDTLIAKMQDSFDQIPGIQTFIQPYHLIHLDFDLGKSGQYKMLVRGNEFDEVNLATTQLTKELEKRSEMSFVYNSLSQDTSMLTLNVNEKLADQFGISRSQIQNVLQAAYGNMRVGTLSKGPYKEHIYLKLLSPFQNNIHAPMHLTLTSPSGNQIPLKAIASWEEKLHEATLVHHDQLPTQTIQFSFQKEIPTTVGLQLVQDVALSMLPDNITATFAGSAKAISSANQDTLLLLLSALIVMYIVLAILYESYIHPLTILSSIPFATLGGVFTLFLFDEPISIFSAVGFLLLIGVVKKNGIMMVDYALQASRNGLSPQEAIIDASLVRFRPIMMTTFAAIMGALPIAIGVGEGSEMRIGLGLVIIGGLIFSQILTLYVTPILYLIFSRKKQESQATKEETIHPCLDSV